MAKKIERKTITGLDIGTTKITTLIGEIGIDGELEIIGVGSHPSNGLKRGVVVDIEATVASIQRSVQEAELMAGCEVRQVFAGVAGSHIKSLNSHGIVAIKDKEVSAYDVERVIDAAKAVAIPADQRLLHVLPQEFIIDNQDGIKEPIGMAGVRLETRVHIVTSAVSAAQNIINCVNRCGLEVHDIILEQLASSHAVLTNDEKELGVCLVDIGGGTSDIAVFYQGAIHHTAVIPIAGDQVTNDIALALRTPAKGAEAVKISHACASPEMASANQMLEVSSVNDRPGRKISTKALSEIVAARYEELFGLIRNELRRSCLEDRIASGIVLTGGASKIEGLVELAEQCFQMPVRCAKPRQITGLADSLVDPAMATNIGLLLHGFQQQFENVGNGAIMHKKKLWYRMKEWFQGNF